MGITVSCSVCDRTFVDIAESMIGQKARCSCGSVVELLPEVASEVLEVREPELVATTTVESDPVASVRPTKPRTTRPKQASDSSKAKSTSSQPGTKPASTEVRTKGGKPKPKTKPKARTAPAHEDLPSPIVLTAAQEAERKKKAKAKAKAKRDAAQKPIAGDAFADLDDILNGVGDTAPILPPRQVRPQPSVRGGQAATASTESTEKQESGDWVIGMGATGISAMLSFGCGSLLVLSRFQSFEGTALGWIAKPLNDLANGVIGSGEMTQANHVTLKWIGVALAVLGGLMIFLGLFLGVRALLLLIAKKSMFGWTRLSTMAMGVLGVFVLVAAIFTHGIHQNHLKRMMNDAKQPAIEGLVQDAGQDPEHVKRLRETYKNEAATFTTSLVATSVFPALMFFGAVVCFLYDEE